MKKHVSSELDTDQREEITQKLKSAARQLNDRTQLYTSGVSDEFSELPTTPEHDQTLVNQSNEFPAPLRQQYNFRTLVKENVLLHVLKNSPEIITKNKDMKFHKIVLFSDPHTHHSCHIFQEYISE